MEIQTHGILQFQSAQDNDNSSGALVSREFLVSVKLYDECARRPKNGEMYGPKYMEEFLFKIAELLEEEDLKTNKKSPAQMLEIITKKNSEKFLLAF